MAPFPIHLAPAGQGPGAYIYSYSICNLSYLDLYQHSRLAKKNTCFIFQPPKNKKNNQPADRIGHPPSAIPIGPSESESVTGPGNSGTTRSPWSWAWNLKCVASPWSFFPFEVPAMSRTMSWVVNTKSFHPGVGWLVGEAWVMMMFCWRFAANIIIPSPKKSV